MRTQASTSPAAEAPQPDPGNEEQQDVEQQEAGQPSGPTPAPVVASTRASRTWVKLMPAVVVLAVILLFVFENLRSTKVSFATASGRLPLALALLAAAALGGLLVFALGSIRILQLRKAIRRSGDSPRR